MDQFSIDLPTGQGSSEDTAKFLPQDVSAMLSQLERTASHTDTSVYRNGQATARLLRMGRKNASFWMIVPA